MLSTIIEKWTDQEHKTFQISMLVLKVNTYSETFIMSNIIVISRDIWAKNLFIFF